MKKTSSSLALVLAGLASAPLVQAGDSPHQFSANVALTTDYIFRGVSQTKELPAIQGGFDYSYSDDGWFFSPYVGIWASNVDFGDDATAEIDYYGGLTGDLFGTGLGWDVGVIYYDYPGGSDPSNDAYIEYYGGLSYSFEKVMLQPSLSFTFYYSPDFFGLPGGANGTISDTTGDAQYYDVSLDLSLPYDLSLGVHVGYQNVSGPGVVGTDYASGYNYGDYKVSLSREWGHFGFDLSYYTTSDQNEACGGDICDGRVVFTVSSSW